MRTVWKYSVPVNDEALALDLDPSYKVLHVACQYGNPRSVEVWVEHDPDSPEVRRVAFLVIGTGHRVPEHWEHVGSTVTANGQLVWHLYRLEAAQAWGPNG